MDVRWRREARSKVRALLRWRAWALVTLVAVIGIVSTGAHNSGPAASRAPARRIAASLELPAHFTRAARLTLDDLANRYIARMTPDEKLGQLFLADLTGDSYDASTAAMVEQMHAGGIILYARSIVTTAQTRALVNAAQAHATLPLFVATDEEGGYVDRMQSIYGFRPSASQIGATGSRAFALSEGARVGRDMSGIGLNFDFGPDLDVQLVDGPDQSTRTYGSLPAAVTTLGGAYLTGMQNNGVLACPKHFPGLGAATSDAHLGLPLITRTRAQIEAVELAPYRDLLATPKMPAELSPAIINGVLRDELGFGGVVVTDALYMDGVAARYDMPEAGVLSIVAGNDLLVGPWTAEQMGAMMQALRDAIHSGRITMARIDQSVRRILVLKMRMGLIPVPLTLTIPVPPLGSMTTMDGPASAVRLAG